jgi:nicotinate-nucleotide adenylyltransferase
MKIGVFGGSFDPVHIAHVALAVECWNKLSLDKVLFVPANISPLKEDLVPASAADRLAMLRMAIGHDPRFGICTLELDRGGVSYTIDTLRELAGEYGEGAELFFLAGADSAESIKRWRSYREIKNIASFVAVPRQGCDFSKFHDEGIEVVEMPLLEISSSMIRQRVAGREPIEGFLLPCVADYIRNKGLYRD